MHEITALPVVVPLAVVAFVLMVWRLYRRTALTAGQVAVAVVACVYGAGVVANSLLPIYVGGDEPRPPWRVFVNLTPLANTEHADMLQNVVLFLPLGILIPLVARTTSALRVLLCGFSICLTMEVLQFVNAIAWHGGHIADINDLLSDTIGVMVGYGIFRVLLALLPAGGRAR